MRRYIQSRKPLRFGTPATVTSIQPKLDGVSQTLQDMLASLQTITKLLQDQYGSTIFISKENAAVQMNISTTPVLVYHATYENVIIIANNTQLTAATDNRIYIGNSATSAASGFPIFESTSQSWILQTGVELWAVSKSNTQDLRFIVM